MARQPNAYEREEKEGWSERLKGRGSLEKEGRNGRGGAKKVRDQVHVRERERERERETERQRGEHGPSGWTEDM